MKIWWRRAIGSAFVVVMTSIGAVGLVSADATAANADTGTSTWLAPMTHSRASCAAGAGINVAMPVNEAYGTVRTEYLYWWDGQQYRYTGVSTSMTSNGAYYFLLYRGNWYFYASAALLAPWHGIFRVYETVTQGGRTSGGWFTAYQMTAFGSDVAYCNV